jgi:hypothetical protein
MVVVFLWVGNGAVWGQAPSEKEVALSKPPPLRLHDKRLKDVYKTLARQYKHIYAHAANDGYIMPNEMQEIAFQRRLIVRIGDIDQRQHRVLGEYKKLKRKRRRSEEEEKRMQALQRESDELETMIRRFACRHAKGYKARYPAHCPKIKI